MDNINSSDLTPPKASTAVQLEATSDRKREFIINFSLLVISIFLISFSFTLLYVMRHTSLPEGFTNISFMDFNWRWVQVAQPLSWILVIFIPLLLFVAALYLLNITQRDLHLGKILSIILFLAVLVGDALYFAVQSQVQYYGWEGLGILVLGVFFAISGLIMAPIMGWLSSRYIRSRRAKNLLFPKFIVWALIIITVIILVFTGWQYVIFTRDLSVCGSANGLSSQSDHECLAHEAVKQGNSSLCKQAYVPAACYYELAFLLKKPELCLEMNLPEHKPNLTSLDADRCFAQIKPYLNP